MLAWRPAGAFFLATYRSAVFGTFLQASTLVSYLLEDFADFSPMAERNDQCASTTLSGALAAGQSTFFVMS